MRGLRGIVLAGAALAAGVAWSHEMAPDVGDLTLTAHELTRYLHVVLLVFWLGPEVAILIAGNHAIDTTLTASQRAASARMMTYYEIMPRVCMSLMLTVGGILSEQIGLEHPWWQAAGIWLLGPVWLVLALAAWLAGSRGARNAAVRLEEILRVVLIVGIPLSVWYSTSTGRLEDAPYVGAKLILFAAILVLGLFARRAFGPFTSGLQQLARDGASPALDATLASSWRRGRVFVLGIWAALLLAALLGIVQPGAPEEEEEHAAAGASAPAAVFRSIL
jgi:hypothetical protein